MTEQNKELLDYIQAKLQSAFTHEGAGILHAGGLAREYAEDFVAKARPIIEKQIKETIFITLGKAWTKEARRRKLTRYDISLPVWVIQALEKGEK